MNEIDLDITDEAPPAWTVIAGANCYASLDQADAIAAGRLFAAQWNSAGDEIRHRALRTATAILDRMRWQGRPLAPTQPLAWPRVADRCPHGYSMAAPIPEAITIACVELAMHLHGQGQLAGASVQMRQLGDAMTMSAG